MARQTPEKMKAAVLDAAGPAEALHVAEVSVPEAGPGHVLIALEYASVGIWDVQQRNGEYGTVAPGTIPGVDGTGTIAAVASDVRDLHLGDRVYSYSFGSPKGFYAQYVSVPAECVALVPSQIEPPIAGAIPCVALTALSGLEVLRVRKGQTIGIFGASGGVGSLAVWLANARDATVIGTARASEQEYVRELGAAYAIDPTAAGGKSAIDSAAPGGFDAVLATASGDVLLAFLEHLRPDAPFAYPNGVSPEPAVAGHSGQSYDGEASHAAFTRLNAAIGSRTIPLRLEIFSLDDVVNAHRRIEAGHVVGKIVLRIA
jgi:NADPH:quinone reductase-like Zn-dependent oxidoreductase